MATLEGLFSLCHRGNSCKGKEIMAEYKHSVSLMAFGCTVRGTAGVMRFSDESKHTATQINSACNKTRG